MRLLTVIFLLVFLVGCSSVQNEPGFSQANTIASTTEAQQGITHNEATQFFDLTPGESLMIPLYEELKENKTEFTGPSMYSRGQWFMHIPVSYDKEIYIECEGDNEIRGKATVILVAYQLKDTNIASVSYLTESLTFDSSPQLNSYVRLDQFSNVIPGESTVEDINRIAEDSGIKVCEIMPSVFGWRMDLPVDEMNAVTVLFDEDYTVVSYAYRLADFMRWYEAYIAPGGQEDSSLVPTDEG